MIPIGPFDGAKVFEGLMQYFSRHWDEAIQLFTECLKIYPDDSVAKMYIERCLIHQQHPPSSDWHGILRMHQK